MSYLRRLLAPKMRGLAFVAVLLLAGLGTGEAVPAMADTWLPVATHSVVFTIGLRNVTVDGKGYTVDVAPYIDPDGRTMLPVRYVADVLGAYKTNWDIATQDVLLEFDHNLQDTTGFDYETNIEFQIGKPAYKVYGIRRGLGMMGPTGSQAWVAMDAAPAIVFPGRTMLPVRVIAQVLGDQVSWDSVRQTVTITVEPFKPSGM